MKWVGRSKVSSEGGGILQPGDRVAVKYVTTIGLSGKDFAVYMGVSDWLDEDVAKHGVKVSEEVARAVAPYCSHLSYRR